MFLKYIFAYLQDAIEQSLVTVHDIATENLGTLCISTLYRPLQVPINSERFESARQKADLVASILQEVGIVRHGGESKNIFTSITFHYSLFHNLNNNTFYIYNTNIALRIGLSDALAKGLLSDDSTTGARILALNLTNGAVQSYVWWVKSYHEKTGELQRYEEDGLQIGKKPIQSYPW